MGEYKDKLESSFDDKVEADMIAFKIMSLYFKKRGKKEFDEIMKMLEKDLEGIIAVEAILEMKRCKEKHSHEEILGALETLFKLKERGNNG